jgi:hypothetical protein
MQQTHSHELAYSCSTLRQSQQQRQAGRSPKKRNGVVAAGGAVQGWVEDWATAVLIAIWRC